MGSGLLSVWLLVLVEESMRASWNVSGVGVVVVACFYKTSNLVCLH